MKDYNEVEILFIEDNPHEAELTIRSLRKHNLANKLMHIDDGADAVDFIFAKGIYSERVNSQEPKLIILDLKLPKIDGLEILRQLKADEKTKLIPVVVLTSSQEERDVVESYRLGVNSYIVKPVNFESFGKAVADLGLYWVILNHSPNS
jgi:two-component system response regulator